MHSSSIASNPFALLMEPEAVLAAVNGSDRLGRLRSRIWRPLDKPVGGRADGEQDAQAGAEDDRGDAQQ